MKFKTSATLSVPKPAETERAQLLKYTQCFTIMQTQTSPCVCFWAKRAGLTRWSSRWCFSVHRTALWDHGERGREHSLFLSFLMLHQPCLELIWVLALPVSCINIPSGPRNTWIQKKVWVRGFGCFHWNNFYQIVVGLGVGLWLSNTGQSGADNMPAVAEPIYCSRATCKLIALIPVCDQKYTAQSSDHKTQKSQTPWSSSYWLISCW